MLQFDNNGNLLKTLNRPVYTTPQAQMLGAQLNEVNRRLSEQATAIQMAYQYFAGNCSGFKKLIYALTKLRIGNVSSFKFDLYTENL